MEKVMKATAVTGIVGLTVAVVVLTVVVVLLSLHVSVMSKQVGLLTSASVGKPLQQVIVEVGEPSHQTAYISEGPNPKVNLKDPGEGGLWVSYLIFGGSYCYLAVDAGGMIVDVKWFKT